MFGTTAALVGGTLVDGLSEPPSKVMMTAPAEATATTMPIAAAASVRGLPIGGRGCNRRRGVAADRSIACRRNRDHGNSNRPRPHLRDECPRSGSRGRFHLRDEPGKRVNTRGGVAGSVSRFGSGKDDTRSRDVV